MKKIFSIPFLFLCGTLFSQQPQVEEYKLKAQKFLDKTGKLSEQYLIDEKGISIFETAHKKEKDSAEFFVDWKSIGYFRNLLKSVSLKQQMAYCAGKKNAVIPDLLDKTEEYIILGKEKGIKGKKIALDPGHIGGSEKEAKLERKMVKVKKDSVSGISDSAEVIEGNITMQTALLLKKKLEAAGAVVMLTRSAEGENAFGYPFETWMRLNFQKAVKAAYHDKEINENEKKKLLNPKTKKEYIFRYFFLQEELKQRAKKINDFHPDLTIAIHYNADEMNLRANLLGDKDLNMVFVPGSFMTEELETKRDRFEFLRLLLSDDIKNSKADAEKLLSSFVSKLNVPAAADSAASYLEEKCVPLSEGIFCRNLAMLRLVHGTIIYGETLFQDNKNEFWKLCKRDISVGGITTNARVQEVADAYYEAVIAIFKQPAAK